MSDIFGVILKTLSFYFVMDIVATATMIPELNELGEAVAALDASGGDRSNLAFTKTARFTKLGAKAGRMVKVIRVVRLVRIVKFLKVFEELTRWSKKRKKGMTAEDAASQHLYRKDDDRVGGRYAEMVTKKLLVLIIIMLLFLPLIYTINVDTDLLRLAADERKSTRVLHGYVWTNISDTTLPNGSLYGGYEKLKASLIRRSEENEATRGLGHQTRPSSVITIRFNNSLAYENVARPLRFDEINVAVCAEICTGKCETVCADNGEMVADYGEDMLVRLATTEIEFDTKTQIMVDASNSIIMTLLTLAVLFLFGYLFIRTADGLVLQPIEAMVNVVRQIRANPLKEVFETDMSLFTRGYETTMLLHTITKIAGLLRVGFGSAGADIISRVRNAMAMLLRSIASHV
eukprot:g3044.t1